MNACERCGRPALKRFCSHACANQRPRRRQGRPVDERFWKYVQVGDDDACWLWTGSTVTGGYGRLAVGSRKDGTRRIERAHRIAWELDNLQVVPQGLFVLHRCDTPACVNPSHLFLGSHQDNLRDAEAKGRMTSWNRLRRTA
jgi:HNH endonuclease